MKIEEAIDILLTFKYFIHSRKINKILLLLFLGLSFPCIASANKLTILHTNDSHSHLLGFGPNADYSPNTLNNDQTRGGASRIASLIKQRKKALGDEHVLLLNGGDYSMGTLFSTVLPKNGLELQLLNALHYDAITFGNHEFDFHPDGLAKSINSALNQANHLPPIIISNMIFDANDPDDDALEKLWQQKIIRPYIVLNRSGLKIGIFGLMGEKAADVSPNAAPVTFEKPVIAAKRMVALLRDKEKVDLVIALSHGGVIKDPSRKIGWHGDDIDLIEQVPGLDIVVGGHSHTPLEQPIIADNRMTVQAGSKYQFLGELTVGVSAKSVQLKSYQLHKIDDSIRGDENIDRLITDFKARVTEQFLQHHHFSFDEILAETDKDLTKAYDDDVLSNLVAESLLAITHSDIALSTNGVIRDPVIKGKRGYQSVADLFRVVPLGTGVINNSPGNDVLKVWVTGREIKNLMEVLLLGYQMRGQSFFPRLAGFKVIYNGKRIPFDQVMQIQLGNSKTGYHNIEISSGNKKLYSLTINSFVGALTGLIHKLSHGLLDFNPKDKQGNQITDLKKVVFDGDPDQAGIQPVKEWQRFLKTVASLPDSNQNGIADLPRKAEKRLLRQDSYNPVKLFQNASWIMYVTGLIVLFILSITLLLLKKIAGKFTNR
ncbi:MAG TPA: bifunctional metallophosphatase/5'-nucleotidase [Aeromonadales bacterium]|nr:bifunctional metallophosphatase/5'-nucleotidase [Aeromonadales bacterium]